MLMHAQDDAQQDTIELDTGPRRLGPERFCAATRTVKPIAEMIRFVVGPHGLVPDLTHKLPGPGYYEITGKFTKMIKSGFVLRGWLNIGLTFMLLTCVAVILTSALLQCTQRKKKPEPEVGSGVA